MRPSSVIVGILGTLAVPSAASAQPPRAPAPETVPDYDLYKHPLFTAGAITFLGTYGLSIGFAAASLDEENRWLYIPLAGPWITLADGSDGDASDRWLLAFDGVAQAAGAAMVAVAYFQLRHQRYVDRRFARLAVTPRSIGVVGRF